VLETFVYDPLINWRLVEDYEVDGHGRQIQVHTGWTIYSFSLAHYVEIYYGIVAFYLELNTGLQITLAPGNFS
jgi:phosphatidylinositol kinase/protein kinase (PI-3  family)